jgi:hypothetical protein
MSIGIQTDYHEYHERKINFRSKFKIENEFGLLLCPSVLLSGESSCYELRSCYEFLFFFSFQRMNRKLIKNGFSLLYDLNIENLV